MRDGRPSGLPLDGLGAEFLVLLRQLDAAFVDLVMGDGAPAGFDPQHFIAPGVPRVRPLLVLLSARAAGRPDMDPEVDLSSTEHVAAAAELLHFAVLLHDTALGRQGGRRRRVARRILGRTVGVLGGNYLTIRALELSRTSATPEILGDLLETLRDISEGHGMRQSLGERIPSEAEALDIAENHTGAGFRFACRAGARLAGASRATVSALGRFGHHLGVAWALAEDLHSFDRRLSLMAPGGVVDRAETARAGLTLATAAQVDPGLGPLWAELVQDGGATDARAQELRARVAATGALSHTRQAIARETWAARRALRGLPDSRARDALERLAAKVAQGELVPAADSG